jgi:hypothetical protein
VNVKKQQLVERLKNSSHRECKKKEIGQSGIKKKLSAGNVKNQQPVGNM